MAPFQSLIFLFALVAAPGATEESSAASCAEQTLRAFAAKDGQRLAELAHPAVGVRFTPFGFVSETEDVVLHPAALRTAFSDGTVRDWGLLGESDDRIVRTFADYVSGYVFHPHFTPSRLLSDGPPSSWEDANWNMEGLRQTLREAYPAGQVFEVRYDGGSRAHEWQVLRLVCAPYRGRHHLVGVIDSSWTP